MKKNYFYLAMAAALLAGKGYAQTDSRCATDEMHKHYKQQNPDVAIYEKQMSEAIASFMATRTNPGKVAKKTTATHSDTDYYDIPVVVHVVHNYGTEMVKDSSIYAMIASLNKFYNKQNNLTNIVAPFKKYIGNAKIRFHLATIDPMGKPTKGITKRFSYLTFGGDDQAKLDQWAPRSYYNIWLENVIGRPTPGGIVLAYSTLPPGGEAFPYSDGVISRADRINDEATIEHETGHYMDLFHPWNSGTGVGEVCGDDEVDDTPPTKGHFGGCAGKLYDTTCATNYYKLYASASGTMDSLVNYPDTTAVQNIMDYSECPDVMVSIGQVWRMRATLNSSIAGRNNLWDSTNLVATGAIAPIPDLPPVTEFVSRSSNSVTGPISFFTFAGTPGTNLHLTNKSWQDTVTSVAWTFSNGASNPNPTFTTYSGINNSFPVSFTEPGWVKVTMAATGNNSGTTTTTYDKGLFVADATATSGVGFCEEFAAGGTRDKWPMFNYYNNGFKWQMANTGFYDNTCVMYQGFDKRNGLELLTGQPKGDYDDFYSIPFDLSSYTSGNCNLNFHYSGASRTSNADDINDSLSIDYSTNKNQAWVNIAALKKGDLLNMGALPTAFTPTSQADWAAKTIAIPAVARTPYTVFRFRYMPRTSKAGMISTGNNFYMDRVHISAWPAGVSDVDMGSMEVKVVPNPTQGDAYVVVTDVANTKAQIVVSDITGKVVYTASEQMSGNAARILIPKQVIATAGIYLVQTVTGSQVNTQKLVVY